MVVWYSDISLDTLSRYSTVLFSWWICSRNPAHRWMESSRIVYKIISSYTLHTMILALKMIFHLIDSSLLIAKTTVTPSFIKFQLTLYCKYQFMICSYIITQPLKLKLGIFYFLDLQYCKLQIMTYLLIYPLTYSLTHSMKLSPSWEANWFSTSQKIFSILRNP